jgi:hypothetical protein
MGLKPFRINFAGLGRTYAAMGLSRHCRPKSTLISPSSRSAGRAWPHCRQTMSLPSISSRRYRSPPHLGHIFNHMSTSSAAGYFILVNFLLLAYRKISRNTLSKGIKIETPPERLEVTIMVLRSNSFGNQTLQTIYENTGQCLGYKGEHQTIFSPPLN